MKKILFYALLILLAVGCKGKNDPVEPTKENIVGNESDPGWTAISDFNPLISMTMLVDVDLNRAYSEQVSAFVASSDKEIYSSGDKVAVFSGDQCLAVVSPDEQGLYYLYVAQPKSEKVSSLQLRYYNASLQNIFVSEDYYPFANETQLGTYGEPLIPTFVLNTENSLCE